MHDGRYIIILYSLCRSACSYRVIYCFIGFKVAVVAKLGHITIVVPRIILLAVVCSAGLKLNISRHLFPSIRSFPSAHGVIDAYDKKYSIFVWWAYGQFRREKKTIIYNTYFITECTKCLTPYVCRYLYNYLSYSVFFFFF